MSWINLASTRYQLRETARRQLDFWEQLESPIFGALKPGLFAVVSGEQELVARAQALSSRVLHDFYSDVQEQHLTQPTVLPNLLGLSVMAHLGGEPQAALWQRIAEAAPAKDETMRELQKVVGRLVAPDVPDCEEEPKRRGHLRDEADWLWRLRREPVRQLFDLSVSPDHELWPYDLQSFVLPLGLLLQKWSRACGEEADAPELYRLGAHPEKHRRVIYERQSERPASSVAPEPGTPESWAGFDAVEFRDGQMYVYHYLGLGARSAPLHEGDLSALQLPEQVEPGWQQVKAHVSQSQWAEVEEHLSTGRCVHCIVYDRNSGAPPELATASKNYGLTLEACDITEA